MYLLTHSIPIRDIVGSSPVDDQEQEQVERTTVD